ncbi:MAG: hypothetical protein ACTHW2_01135 [Tissierella sp.]|uniref:hypothetical protein n=1 Tax=Tissierella sp. TaxID=41274 RepID=UPI003F99F11E
MEKVVIALLGTVVGFLLSWFKEFIQDKAKVKMNLKTGILNYLKLEENDIGEIIKVKTEPTKAEQFYLNLKFDILNIGKISTGLIDISIELSANNQKLYYSPILLLPIDDKKLENISFNLDSNKVYTVETTLILKNQDSNSFLFDDISLLPNQKKSLKIKVIATTLHKQKSSLRIEPLSILHA